MITRKKFNIGEGINFTALTDEKFKTSVIRIYFIFPIDGDTASADAFPAYLFEDTNSTYPDMTSFNTRLLELYGANMETVNFRMGDHNVLSFRTGGISDKYALEGEKISVECFRLVSECLLSPVINDGKFSEKIFEMKRREFSDAIAAEINDKRTYAMRKANRIIFRGEPSGNPFLGDLSQVEKLNNDNVMASYRKILECSHIEIFFAGNTLEDELLDAVKSAFSKLPRKNVTNYLGIPSPLKEKTEYAEESLEVVQSKMVMAFKYGNKFRDREEVIKLFCIIFGSSPFSLLFKNVREKLSLCYYCTGTPVYSKSVIVVDSGLELENAEKAQEEILKQLDVMKNGSFDDDLLDQAVMAQNTALKAVGDFSSSVCSWYFDRFEKETPDTPESFFEKINKVTKEEIAEFARSLELDTVFLLKGQSSKNDAEE